jgi:hypothetical protein
MMHNYNNEVEEDEIRGNVARTGRSGTRIDIGGKARGKETTRKTKT